MVRTRTGRISRKDSIEQPSFVEDVPSDHSASDSDDDAPVEVSSKNKIPSSSTAPDMMLVESEEPQMSLYEEIEARKQREQEDRMERKKAKKLRRRKVQKGEYVVQTKKAQFKVITLDSGIKSTLEPEVNFKAELLKARTRERRVAHPKSLIQRSKWVGVRP